VVWPFSHLFDCPKNLPEVNTKYTEDRRIIAQKAGKRKNTWGGCRKINTGVKLNDLLFLNFNILSSILCRHKKIEIQYPAPIVFTRLQKILSSFGSQLFEISGHESLYGTAGDNVGVSI
jgi:hypothetical protein